MKIEDIAKACKFIGEHWSGDDGGMVEEAARLLRECHAAGFITDSGEVRKLHGTCWVTKDGGIVVSPLVEVYHLAKDGTVFACEAGVANPLMDWYSTREAAEAARGEK